MKKLLSLFLMTSLTATLCAADWGYDVNKPLLSSASQLSTNAASRNCDSSLDNLLDANDDSYFHSAWTTEKGSDLPNAKHYLQWHLPTPQRHLMFTYLGMNWESAHNSPQDVTILATNTPADESSWVEVVRLQELIADKDRYPAQYTSPHLDCRASYTDFRMVVNATTTGNRERTYKQQFFCLAEFQVYQAVEGMKMPDACVPNSQAINIVFIGNSITFGATLPDRLTEAPPVHVGGQLCAALQRPVRVGNCGVSGATTWDWQPGRPYYNRAYGKASEFAALGGRMVFTIMLGTNDSAEKGPTGSPVSTEDYERNMHTIIDSFMAAFPGSVFIVNYPMWYSPNTHNGATYLQPGLTRLQTYHPVIDRIVHDYQQRGCAVYLGSKAVYGYFENNLPLFTTEPGYDGDFYLHPNPAGAIKLAEFWTESIRQVIDTDDQQTKRQQQWGLIDRAMRLVSEQFAAQSVAGPGLIQCAEGDGSQLSSTMTLGCTGTLANLIDGDKATIYQTGKAAKTMEQYHCLDIDLKRTDVRLLTLSLSGFQGADASVARNQMPCDITVMGRANRKAPWVRLGRLNTGFPGKADKPEYTSPALYLGKNCRYLRLQVNRNVTQAMSKGGVPYYNLSELQCHQAQAGTDAPYHAVKGMAPACDKLVRLCAKLSKRLGKAPTLTSQDEAALRAAMQRIYQLISE